MKCGWNEETLSAWVLGLLPPPKAGQLKAHAAACPECQARALALTQAMNRLQPQPRPLPEFLPERVVQAAGTLKAKPIFWNWGWVPLAAACVGAFLWLLPPRLLPTAALSTAELAQGYQDDLQAIGYQSGETISADEESLDYEWLGLPSAVSQYLN